MKSCVDCSDSILMRDKHWNDIEKNTKRFKDTGQYDSSKIPQNHPFLPEVLRGIFVYLPAYSLFGKTIRVCKYWYAVSHTDAFFRVYYHAMFQTRNIPRYKNINLKKLLVKEFYLYRNMSGIVPYSISDRLCFNVIIIGGRGTGKSGFLSIVEHGKNNGEKYTFSDNDMEEPIVLKVDKRPDFGTTIPKKCQVGGMEFCFFGKRKVDYVTFKLLEDEMFILIVDSTNHKSFREAIFSCVRIKYEVTNSFVILIETKTDLAKEREVDEEEVFDLCNRQIARDGYGYIDHHVKLNLLTADRKDIIEIMKTSVQKLFSRKFPGTRLIEDMDDIIEI